MADVEVVERKTVSTPDAIGATGLEKLTRWGACASSTALAVRAMVKTAMEARV
jgi:hypothetical protein